MTQLTHSNNVGRSDCNNRNVTFVTTMGDISFELYWEHAPRTCKNFYDLAKENYYDGCLFHRIVRDFVIQGGDPTGTGKGGASIYGSTFEDEFHPHLRHVGAGILSMANSGQNTNGSQFFITLAPAPHLDGKHTIFGRVRSGMQVVKKMSMVQVDSSDRPVFDIKIIRSSTAEDVNDGNEALAPTC